MTTATASTVGTRIISADCHVNEPPWIFDTVPASLRERAPTMMRGVDGGDGWSFDGQPPKRTLGVEATAGQPVGGAKMSGLTFDEIMPGNYDGAAHVADMALDGVDVSVVYPTNLAFVYNIDDRELAVACMRAYNDWILGEFQKADPARLVGLAMLPVDDGMETCTAELERCVDLGARGFFIPGYPARPYHDPYYDPLYARAAGAGVSLNFHRTFGGRPPEQDWDEVMDMKITTGGTVYRFFSAVRPFTYLVFSGVFDRHPDLRIVGAEVNFGWLPFWAQTMEQNFDIRNAMDDDSAGVARRPTEYLGTNLFVTVLDDHVGFGLVPEHPWMADTAMFSSDYPHSVSLWPRSTDHAARLTEHLDPVAAEKILSGNAARLYGV